MVFGCGGGIRTRDLEVMGLTSCQTALPRGIIDSIERGLHELLDPSRLSEARGQQADLLTKHPGANAVY